MQVKPRSLLLVEPRLSDARLLRRLLEAEGLRVTHVESLAQARGALASEGFETTLLALGLPDAPDHAAISDLTAGGGAVVVLVDPGQEPAGIRAVQAGAKRWIAKDFGRAEQLRTAVSGLAGPRPMPAGDSRPPQNASILATVVDGTPDGLLLVDDEGRVQLANPAARAMLGATATAGSIFPHPAQVGALERSGRVLSVQAGPTRWDGRDCQLLSLRDDTERHRELHQLREETARLSARVERLGHLAARDPLTELLNRRGLEEALRSELSRADRTGEETLAALIDCDDFKRINDTIGHAGGDAVLRTIAQRLNQALRPSDWIGRIGGDEFLVLLPETSLPAGMGVAQRLRTTVGGEPIDGSSARVGVTVSIGLVTLPSHATSLDCVLAATRAALLHSKAAGKDRVVTEGGMQNVKDAITGVVAAITQGVGLRTLAQPIFSLGSGEVFGYELLSRGPAGDFESPESFFRLALQQQVLEHADRRCLDSSVEASRALPARMPVHLNLFPGTLLGTPSAQLLARLEPVLSERPACVELSQHHIGDPVAVRARVEPLREAGIRVALDHVGSGRTSLETLIHLGPDLVKLDRRLVTGAGSQPGRTRTLERLLRVLELQEAEAIAVGIETTADREALSALGVTLGQGFVQVS